MKIFGETGAKIIGMGIAILLLSTVSSYVFIGPRIMQVMGEDHNFIHFLSKKNRHDIPINAFWLQLGISLLFIFSSSFEQVLMYAGISLILTTALTVASLFVLRFREPDLERPYLVWGYPLTPLIFLVVNAWILFYTFRERPLESFVGVGIIIFSISIYYISRLNQRSSQ